MPTVRYLRPLKSAGLGDRLLEPAERLRCHGTVGKRHDVGAYGAVELRQQFLAAAPAMPGHQHVRIHAVGRARTPERQRVLLAVVVDDDAMTAVERALGNRVQQSERRHDGTRGQHLDLEVAAGHVVHGLGIVQRVFVEDVLGWPCRLESHADRAGLALGDHRKTQRCARGRCAGRRLQELAARRRCGRLLGHVNQLACHVASLEDPSPHGRDEVEPELRAILLPPDSDRFVRPSARDPGA